MCVCQKYCVTIALIPISHHEVSLRLRGGTPRTLLYHISGFSINLPWWYNKEVTIRLMYHIPFLLVSIYILNTIMTLWIHSPLTT